MDVQNGIHYNTVLVYTRPIQAGPEDTSKLKLPKQVDQTPKPLAPAMLVPLPQPASVASGGPNGQETRNKNNGLRLDKVGICIIRLHKLGVYYNSTQW